MVSTAHTVANNSQPPGWLERVQLAPMRRSFDFLAALLSGLVLSFTISGQELFWAAWIGLIPAFCVLYRSGFRRAFAIGAVFGLALCLGCGYWLPTTTLAVQQSARMGGFYLLVIALFFALFFGALFCLIRSLIPPPNARFFPRLWHLAAIACLWAGFEYGYALMLVETRQLITVAAGHSQWNHPAMIQLAAFGGVFAISFLIVAFNAAVADDLCRRRWVVSPWVGGCIALCVLGGYLRLSFIGRETEHGRSLSVAVLQGNIPMFTSFSEKDASLIAHRYLELGTLVNRIHPDLIVWTETAVPWPLREDDDLVTTMLHITAPSHAYHILGTILPVPNSTNLYSNSILFIHPNGDITAQYDKRRLLSFVETTIYVPFLSRIGVVPSADRENRPGRLPPAMSSPLGRIGVMTCNENLYACAARESVALGSEFLVSPGNDFWFRDIAIDNPIDMHFLAALFRAVETRRDMVIANNVGISAIIDAGGRILKRSEKRTQACLSGRITQRRGKTFYVQAGDLFAQICICLGLLAVIRARVSKALPKCAGNQRPRESAVSIGAVRSSSRA